MYTVFKEIEEFIRELYKTKDFIPIHQPVFKDNVKRYVLETIDSTYVSYIGKYVEEFEKRIADYTGAKYSIATVNGTSALHLALLAVGVSEGDEVITQPVTFVATCNAIRYCGAFPVFVDVSPKTLGMSPESLKYFLDNYVEFNKNNEPINKITGRRIKACVPVHIFGHPCEIDRIVEICKEFNIEVIEDSAQALGSLYKNRHVGTFGVAGIFSFNGNKIITTGGGGMVITNNKNIADTIKHLSTTAKVSHPYEYFHDRVGFNYRMPNINAALGLAQMEYIEELVEKKRELAKKYEEFLSNFNFLEFIKEPPYTRSNYWLVAVAFKDKRMKEDFLKYMNERKIQVRPLWKLMYKLPMYKDCFRVDTEVAEELEESIVALPNWVRV